VVTVRPLRIDFVPRRHPPAWLWYLASAILAGVAVQQGWTAWQLSRQASAAEVKVSELRLKIERVERAHQRAHAEQAIEPPYAKDAAAIAKVAAFPVEQVFASIESAQVSGVRLTSLDVSATGGTARVELEFSDSAALSNYLAAINAGEEQPRWRLVQARMGLSGTPSTATIAARWR
jgi:hypothetical protein